MSRRLRSLCYLRFVPVVLFYSPLPGQGLEAPATPSLKFRLSSSESLALGLPSPWEKLVASTIRMLARKAI